MTNLFSCNAVVGSSSAQTPDFPCVADLLAHLDRLGLERALTWHVGARDFYTRWGNERLLAEIAATPGASGRVIPSFVVTPTMLIENGAVEWLRATMAEHGVRALRFSLYRGEWSLDEIEPLLRAVQELSPLLLLDLRENFAKPALVELSAHFPELPVVLCNAMWPDMVRVFDLMHRRENVRVETSWVHSWGTVALLARTFGAERVLFGTGPASHAGAAIAGLLEADLPAADRELIAHGNAERLLDLPARAAPAVAAGLESRPLWGKMARRETLGVDFIDAHCHIGPMGMWPMEDGDPAGQARTMLAWMDRLGISLSLISGEEALFCEPVAGNLHLEETLAPYGERFHGYLGFNPYYRRELEARLDDFFSRPFFVGFKVLGDYWRAPYTDERYRPAWEYAHAHRLPILAHTWGGPFNAPALLREIAPAYPEAVFVLGHSGGSVRSEAEELAAAHPNVYLEWCGSFTCPDSWVRTVERVGADHVVFGSDAIAHDIYWELGRLLSQDLPDERLAPILGANMREILARRR